jgi:transposase-like protein
MSTFKKEEKWCCPECGATGRVRYPFYADSKQMKCPTCGMLFLFVTDGVSCGAFLGPSPSDMKPIYGETGSITSPPRMIKNKHNHR